MFIPLSFIFFPFKTNPNPRGLRVEIETNCCNYRLHISRPATLRSSRVRAAAPARCRAASLRSSRPRQLRRPRRRVDRHGDLRQVLAAPLLCQSHSSGAATNRNNQTTRKKNTCFFWHVTTLKGNFCQNILDILRVHLINFCVVC